MRRLAAALLSGLMLFGPAVPSGQDAQQKPTFRAAVALVPVNVSVLGRDGRPVLDLKKEDFTILEDGVPQEVGHFSLENLVAAATMPHSGDTVGRRNVPVLELAPQQRRVFLVALTTWRGSRIQEPNRALDALREFVRGQLLPQDVMAVIAYNRATAFTTNHGAISEVIERYRARSERIGASLEEYFSGLRALYGSGRIPDPAQREIDAVFDVPGASMRQLAAVDARPMRSNAMPPIPAIPEEGGSEGFAAAEMGFDVFVSRSLQSMQGLSQLFAGIQYMRNIEGQKRLLYIGPGMGLPSTDADNSVAAMANDARVALDMIQAGGIEGLPMWRGAIAGRIGFDESFNFTSLRSLAQQTGGQALIAKYTKPALDRVDTVTRTQYLIGYYPKNADWNGKYRRIEVKVNRPNVEVAWRQGYYARQDRTPYDGRELFTFTRISSAARFQAAVNDIKMKAEVRDAVAILTIDISNIALKSVDDRRVGQLRVAVFFGDAEQRLIDERWGTIDLSFTGENYGRYLTTGVEFRCPVPVTMKPTYMKAVVYHYDTDLLGSVERQLRATPRRH
jgi:VWFA-related protein